MNKPLNIVYFNYMQDLYGSSIGSTIKAERLLTCLEQSGNHIRQYWRYRDYHIPAGSGMTQPKISGIKPLLRRLLYTPREVLRNLVELFKEYRFLRQDWPDLVIVRIDAYRYSAALLCWVLRIPLVLEADGANSYEWLTFNNKDGNIWKSWLLCMEHFCFRVADGVFVQSNVSRDYYSELYPRQAEKIIVITNGADIRPDVDTSARQELDIPADAVICGFVGSMHYWHNTGLLIDMLREVMPMLPDFYMVLVGSGGPMADSLREQCNSQDWKDRVRFTGYVPHDQTHRYMNIMDITLAPYGKSTLFYYSPVKIFEYMAQGRAVISTRVGQIAELITDHENGIFFDPDKPGDLTNKVIELAKDKELRTRLGAQARDSIAGEHTWAHKARQLEALCRSIMDKKRGNG